MSKLILLIVDGWGVGAQEDAHEYGDQHANTMLHVSEHTQLNLPNFELLGLGNLLSLPSVQPVEQPMASIAKLRERSAGKDSTTGHWELAGITLEKAFPTYPEGFPDQIIEAFCSFIGSDGVLCNAPYSGTQVIEDFGEEHLRTGRPIVYTSADSVFQVATHEDRIPIQQLYAWCEWARSELMIPPHQVGRVIARPFNGEPGNFQRISEKRHDWSADPVANHLVLELQSRSKKTVSIGKVSDLFNGEGFDVSVPTNGNEHGLEELLKEMKEGTGDFIFVNLIDTDQLYGHRLDPVGYANSLIQIDAYLPKLMHALGSDDMLIITGDHGNDPCVPSTDHTREFVPMFLYQKGRTPQDLGTRDGFAQVAATVMQFFEFPRTFHPMDFLS